MWFSLENFEMSSKVKIQRIKSIPNDVSNCVRKKLNRYCLFNQELEKMPERE